MMVDLPFHIDYVLYYIVDFENFYDDYIVDDKLALYLFNNCLRVEVKKNVVMFNPPTLRDAYALAKLVEDILACTKPIMVHDDTYMTSVDSFVEYKDLSLNYISTNDVMPMDLIIECENLPLTYLSKDDVEPMDPIVECENIPFMYLSSDDVEVVEAIKEYETFHPPYIHTDDLAFKCSSLLEQTVECENIPLTYITMDDLKLCVFFKHLP